MRSGFKRHSRTLVFLAMWGASVGVSMLCYSAAADQDTRVLVAEGGYGN
jgi:hypothetical protein